MGRRNKRNKTRQINKIPLQVVDTRAWPFDPTSVIDKEIATLTGDLCVWMSNYRDMLVNQRRGVRRFVIGLRCAERLDKNEPTTMAELATALEFKDKKEEIIETLTFNDKAIARFKRNPIYIEHRRRFLERESLPNFRINVVF